MEGYQACTEYIICKSVSVIDPLTLHIGGIKSKESEEKVRKMFPKASNIDCIKNNRGFYKR